MRTHKLSPAEKAAQKHLREEYIQYTEERVEMPYPAFNRTFTDPSEPVLGQLPEKDRRVVRTAYEAVGKGISKKGIFFGAGARYSTLKGQTGHEFGFNFDTDAGDTMCAERVLLGRLSQVEGYHKLEALAIVANIYRDKDHGHEGPRAPCHTCREHYRRTIKDPSLPVIMASSKLNDVIYTRLGNLLPLAFPDPNQKEFRAESIAKYNIRTLKIFRRPDLEFRSQRGDEKATTILQTVDKANMAYLDGLTFRKRFGLSGVVTGVAASAVKHVSTGSSGHTEEEILLSGFSPSLSGKSSVRDLMAQIQENCGLHGRVNVVALIGDPQDFLGGLPVPTAGARQAVYDRVFLQESNTIFVMAMRKSNIIVTVDARHLLPLGKAVAEQTDIEKLEALSAGMTGNIVRERKKP